MVGSGVAEGRPRFTTGEAEAIAQRHFGVRGEACELPSDRDQNFRIRPRGSDASDRILKISSSHEDPGVLDLQQGALQHLADRDPGLAVPRLVQTDDDRPMTLVEGRAGRAHRVRMVTWIAGRPLADVLPVLPRLLDEVGRYLARLDRALATFEHPAADRPFRWDLARGIESATERLERIADPGRRALVKRHLRRVRERLDPRASDLPRAIIHGDANTDNLLVRVEGPGELREAVRVAGIIDFGDMVRSWRVAEPAIAAAYAILRRSDPLRTAAHLAGGYHRVRPLDAVELEVLFPLVVLRLCVSVSVAAEQRRAEPGRPYLRVSETAAWNMLSRLEAIDFEEAHYRLRDACGLAPCPPATKVVTWLEAEGDRAAPVVDPDPRDASTTVFDFSVGSLEHADVRRDAGPERWTRVLFERMTQEGTQVGLGRWAESRWWYADPRFQGGASGGAASDVPGDEAPDPRTVHLGVDLFVEPGSPVRAPFDGRVHTVTDNDRPLDYGPTLILTHDADGTPFHTLYGHLRPDVLERWSPGDRVERGEEIAAVGTFPRNGGWAPHLHVQVVVDLLGRGGDFPGVAPPEERTLWAALSPDPNLFLRIPDLEPAPRPPGTDDLLPDRGRRLGPSLSLSYQRPLTLVRGWMQHLFDEEGRAYLDGRNNVPHVGHAHPRVAEAAAHQEAVLNTNTRYLHPARAAYVERLLSLFPDPLEVCYLVCTGSEANELALRMARAFTGTKETVVVEGAYHGNTAALVEISPYKYGGPGGDGPPPWVHEVPVPDPYRGRYRGSDPRTGHRYAEHVEEEVARLAAEDRGPAAFVVEPLMGAAGQIQPPAGFLDRAFAAVRNRGGVAIADEVQVGFGRVGSRFWGFELHDVVPDIVTLGKPIGNGHPLAAVVTTREVAAAFDTGMEYFNTFGGSPVSCEIGLAVLDVLEDEKLQERALDVGGRLKRGLKELAARHPVLGDVRGSGLFLGAELVNDPADATPAPERARYGVERLRDHRILLGTDGIDGNVLKIKPPLQFGSTDADRLVTVLDRILAEDPMRVDRKP